VAGYLEADDVRCRVTSEATETLVQRLATMYHFVKGDLYRALWRRLS
jgi:hypothetical protein